MAVLRWMRRGTRTVLLVMPLVLGVAPVALPCGITRSMELAASTSGSLAGGAAVMAGFVIGTAPLFTLLGVALRQSTAILRGRMRIATGVLVAAVGVWTVVSGLRAGGWIAPPGGPAQPLSAAASAGPVGPRGRPRRPLDRRNSQYTPRPPSAPARGAD